MYPLSGILSNYVTFLISLIVLAVVSLVRGVYPTLWLFQALVPLIVVFFLALGTGLILSTVAVFFRDLEYLWGVATMIIMYASAIFYKTETVATERNIWIFRLNPVYAVIDNFRSAVFGGPMDLGLTAYAAGVSAALVVLGAFVFSKNQDRFILHL